MYRSIKQKIKGIISSNEQPVYKNIQVGNYSVKALYESKLDEYLQAHANYSINFARLAAWVLDGDTQSGIIDVGANIGDTVALLRTCGVKNKIYCIEGNQTYFELLKENAAQFENIELINCFLSDTDQNINAKVERYAGTAQIVESTGGEVIATRALDTMGDELGANRLGILKVDTDGFDIAILNGALKLIEKDKPMLFFEYDNVLNTYKQSCLDFLFSLADHSYQHVIFYDNFGRMLMHANIDEKAVLTQLDRYIRNKKGAFPYYDVAVFPAADGKLFHNIIAKENGL